MNQVELTDSPLAIIVEECMGSEQNIRMKLNAEEYISKLELGGAWACRSLTDYIFNLHFSGSLGRIKAEEINSITSTVFRESSGYSTKLQKNRIKLLLNINLSANPKLDFNDNIYSPLDLEELVGSKNIEDYQPNYWQDMLLYTSKKDFESLAEFIEPIQNDAPIFCDRKSLLYDWSFL